jgi:hypothetical protein
MSYPTTSPYPTYPNPTKKEGINPHKSDSKSDSKSDTKNDTKNSKNPTRSPVSKTPLPDRSKFPTQTTVSIVNIPFMWIMRLEMFLITVSMYGSLAWALWFNFTKVVTTHCRDAKQFFPSFSAVIGNAFPELFIWRLGLLFMLPLRFSDAYLLHCGFTRMQLYYQPDLGGGCEEDMNEKNGKSGKNRYFFEKKEKKHFLALSNEDSAGTDIELDDLNNTDLDDLNNMDSIHDPMSKNNPQNNKNNPQNNQNNQNNPKKTKKNPTDQMYHYLGSSNTDQAGIYYSHQNVSNTHWWISFFHSLAMIIEYSGLTLLTYVSSSENFLPHEVGFIVFIISSQIHFGLNFFLTKMHWKLSGRVFWVQNLKLCFWVLNISAMYGCYYFYTRHNSTCEDYIYSFFGLSEYTLVFSNVALNLISYSEICWEGQFSFSFSFPHFGLNSNYDTNFSLLSEYSDEYEREWLYHGQIDVPILIGKYNDGEKEYFLTHAGQHEIDLINFYKNNTNQQNDENNEEDSESTPRTSARISFDAGPFRNNYNYNNSQIVGNLPTNVNRQTSNNNKKKNNNNKHDFEDNFQNDINFSSQNAYNNSNNYTIGDSQNHSPTSNLISPISTFAKVSDSDIGL